MFRDVFGGEEIDGGVDRARRSPATPSFGNTNNPQSSGEKVYSLRDDFTTSFNAIGRHDIKTGGEYIRYTMDTAWCNSCNGALVMQRRARRRTSSSSSLYGTMRPRGTWRALSPLVVRLRGWPIGDFAWAIKRNLFAGWLQDDWAVRTV